MAPTLKSTPNTCASKSRILCCVRWYCVPSTPTSASARGPICPRGTPGGSMPLTALLGARSVLNDFAVGHAPHVSHALTRFSIAHTPQPASQGLCRGS